MRTVAGIALAAATLAACAAPAPKAAPTTLTPAPHPLDVQLRAFLRSKFTVGIPPGYHLNGGEGSTDYALFAVLHGTRRILTIYVGDWAIDMGEWPADAPDQEKGFRRQFGGLITDDRTNARLISRTPDGQLRAAFVVRPDTRAYLAKFRAEVDTYNDDHLPAPPPSPLYLLIEILPGLTPDETRAAEAIALSVSPRTPAS